MNKSVLNILFVGLVIFALAFCLIPYGAKQISPKTNADVVEFVKAPVSSDVVNVTVSPTNKLIEPSVTLNPSLKSVFPNMTSVPTNWCEAFTETEQVVVLDGVKRTFIGKRTEDTAKATTWVSNNGLVQGDTFVICSTPTFSDARLVEVGGKEYEIHMSADGVRITTIVPNQLECANRDTIGSISTKIPDDIAADIASDAINGVYYYDVLVLYLPDLKTPFGATQAESFNAIKTIYVSMNTWLTQSGITNFQWRLVGAVPTPTSYSAARPIRTGTRDDGTTYTFIDLNDDLNAISSSDPAKGILIDFVDTNKTATGADGVQFIIDQGSASAVNSGGLGNVNYFNNVCYRGNGTQTMAHELGHNSNCLHDWEASPDTGVIYNHAHEWVVGTENYGTIMSYVHIQPHANGQVGGVRISYFSNPNITYNGVAIGVAGTTTGAAADNARVIRETAPNVAGWNLDFPYINTQPSTASVRVGNTLSLSVVVVGTGPLTYQG